MSIKYIFSIAVMNGPSRRATEIPFHPLGIILGGGQSGSS